jgi:hypothetical protein
MEKTSYKGFKIEDQVTVYESVPSYDGGPMIEPGMIGVIKKFPPQVIITGEDRSQYFAYIEFRQTYKENGREFNVRGGVNVRNLKK